MASTTKSAELKVSLGTGASDTILDLYDAISGLEIELLNVSPDMGVLRSKVSGMKLIVSDLSKFLRVSEN